MVVRVHVAPHPDALVTMLCERLRRDPADPFTPEVISVPTRGIERWLTQRIALELADVAGGIAANIEFPSPRRLVREIATAIPDLGPSIEAWEGPGFAAHVVEAIDVHLDESHMALLRRHLDAPMSSRIAAGSKIARLFTRYARRRPGMIRDWSEGRDLGPDGSPVDDHHRWQPELWRAVRARLGIPSIPELGQAVLDPLRTGAIDLPDRFAVYGLTAADPFDLDVLAAAGKTTDVHLHLLHPSPALWAAVDADADRSGDDPTLGAAVHPLLRSWARHSRQLQLVVEPIADATDVTTVVDSVGDQRLLARLQADVRDNRVPVRLALEALDRSVQIHVCHGARRQVEVLRDAILHILADDPTLEPRDVVIMTPDLARYAPLLEAGFPHGRPDLPDLRVRIADRSPAATNPLVQFTAALLDLADGRLEAASLRELVTRPLVQQRFAFDADTADAIVRIIDDSTVAWGLDADHRARWGVHDIAERSWRRGLDRALAGVFFTDSPVRVAGDAAPLDGIEGQDARPVGILAAIVDRLAAISDRFGEPMPLSGWADAIADATRMLADPGWDDEWQWNQLERLLAETFPTGGAADPLVSLGEAKQAMRAWTDDRPSPLMFRTGDVTVCTLAPMRSVPYRVVCLLGMDDDHYPRRSRSDGDDLLGDDVRAGDHDRAGEDRQLLLDAVMAAGDHLVITYSGRDEITNAEYPPAVPVAELTDVLGAMIGDDRVSDRIRTRHPLQSFSRDVFTRERLGVAGPWGFDPVQLAGARAVQERHQTTLAIEEPWPPIDPPEVVRLHDLVRFLLNPVRTFVRSQLGFGIPTMSEAPDDSLPVELGGLEAWALKDRLILGLTLGHDLDSLIAREQAADTLPPARLAEEALVRARSDVEALWTAAQGRGYDRGNHRRFMATVDLGGRLIEGAVFADPVQAHLPMITPSRIKAGHRLRAFVELCFLTAVEPELPWHALLLARRERSPGFIEVSIGPLGADREARRRGAEELLAGLIQIFDDGHREPLALPCETAYAWQRRVDSNRARATADARDKFDRSRFTKERDDPAHELVFGSGQEFEQLLATGFEVDCRRLWDPIIPFMKDAGL